MGPSFCATRGRTISDAPATWPQDRGTSLRSWDRWPGGGSCCQKLDRRFTGGVRVAANVINGDTRADLLVAASTGTLDQVQAFENVTPGELMNFFADDPLFFGSGAFIVGRPQ